MVTPIDHLWNYIILKRKRVIHGKNLRLNGRVHIHGSKGRIIIGDDCIITSDTDVNPTAGGAYSHLSVWKEGRIIIGNNVGMSLVCITASKEIKIEDNVLIGANSKIWDTDFHDISYKKRSQGERPQSSPVLIKEGAFIGACTIILKGVSIGKHSVVGAGSVVTRSVPDNEVWAGNPARFIKKIEEL